MIFNSQLANQIFKYFANKGQTNPNLWFWKTNIGDEVDFLIEKGKRFYAIECKLKSVPNKNDLKGINSLKRYYGPKNIIKSILACKVKMDFPLNENVFVSNFMDCEILKEIN